MFNRKFPLTDFLRGMLYSMFQYPGEDTWIVRTTQNRCPEVFRPKTGEIEQPSVQKRLLPQKVRNILFREMAFVEKTDLVDQPGKYRKSSQRFPRGS